MSERRIRDPYLSVLFNVFAPGLGFLYLGKPLLAFALPILYLVIEGAFAWTRLIFIPAGFYTFKALTALYSLGILVAAWRMAGRLGLVTLSRSQRWYYYFIFLFLFGYGRILLQDYRDAIFGYAILDVNSASVDASLLPGDQVVAEIGPVRSAPLKRWDVVYTNSTLQNRKWRRILGLPGDTLEILNREISVNKKTLPDPQATALDLFHGTGPHHLLLEIGRSECLAVGDSDKIGAAYTDNSTFPQYQGGWHDPDALHPAQMRFVCISWQSRSTIRPWRNGKTVDVPPILYQPLRHRFW